MIFQYTLDLLLSGRKTQTCRLAKPGETAVRGSDGAIEAVKAGRRDKYRVGKTYAVQPARTAAAVARIRLTGIERKNVQAITEAEAQAEGYDTREEFFAVWRDVHGEKKLTAEVWALRFELVGENA
jgi:hypothetical protein